MSGDRLNFRITTPTRQFLAFDPDADISGTTAFPFSPQIWFSEVVIDEAGDWTVEVLINDQAVGSQSFTGG